MIFYIFVCLLGYFVLLKLSFPVYLAELQGVFLGKALVLCEKEFNRYGGVAYSARGVYFRGKPEADKARRKFFPDLLLRGFGFVAPAKIYKLFKTYLVGMLRKLKPV